MQTTASLAQYFCNKLHQKHNVFKAKLPPVLTFLFLYILIFLTTIHSHPFIAVSANFVLWRFLLYNALHRLHIKIYSRNPNTVLFRTKVSLDNRYHLLLTKPWMKWLKIDTVQQRSPEAFHVESVDANSTIWVKERDQRAMWSSFTVNDSNWPKLF